MHFKLIFVNMGRYRSNIFKTLFLPQITIGITLKLLLNFLLMYAAVVKQSLKVLFVYSILLFFVGRGGGGLGWWNRSNDGEYSISNLVTCGRRDHKVLQSTRMFMLDNRHTNYAGSGNIFDSLQ